MSHAIRIAVVSLLVVAVIGLATPWPRGGIFGRWFR